MFTREEVISACLEKFEGDTLAAEVVVEKYLLRDKAGNYLEKTPSDMFRRIAGEFARVEARYPNPMKEADIFRDLDSMRIIPQGSPLYGIGNNHSTTSIANCFVIESPVDSYSGILKADEDLVNVLKRRGGAGIDLSHLRPRGSVVNNSARTSDGVTCFMERYSNTTKEVAVQGRRGALMLTLHCHHPDLEAFIDIKRNTSKVTGANISVKWTDEFLAAVRAGAEFTLRWPVDCAPEQAKFTKRVNARKVWDRFVENNWLSAEPGCLFWDTIIKDSLSDVYPSWKTTCTNPCSELPLSDNSSCILILINLTKIVQLPFTKDASLDLTELRQMTRNVSRLADDMIDLELEKIDRILGKIRSDEIDDRLKTRELEMWERIKAATETGRRVGIGITGLADALAMLGLKYDSDKALDAVDRMFSAFSTEIMASQALLAGERGAFKDFNWNREKGCRYIAQLPKAVQDAIRQNGRRNISVTTVAPAGSVSILAQCSSGIEPVFQLEYSRRRKLSQDEIAKGVVPSSKDPDGTVWASYKVVHPGLAAWSRITKETDITKSPYYKATAHDIDWNFKIRMQSVIQKYITHSISNTCNLPSDITKEKVSELYLKAHEAGCKGMTVYREGSRDGVLKSVKTDGRLCPKRPEILPCDIHNVNIEGNSWIFFIGLLNGTPYEIFGGRKSQIEIPKRIKTGWLKKNGKVGGRRTYDLILGTLDDTEDRMVVKDIASSFSSTAQSYTRLISLGIRHSVPVQYICDQLNKDTAAHMFTFEKGISRILKTYIKDGCRASGVCEKCGAAALQYQDGCKYCVACGDSKCG